MKHFEIKMKPFEAKMKHSETKMKHFEAKICHEPKNCQNQLPAKGGGPYPKTAPRD